MADPADRSPEQSEEQRGNLSNSVSLGHWFGIEVGLHWSWILIAGLVTVSLALSYFPAMEEDLSTPVYWIMGAVAAVLFFLSVLLHELAHSVVARARGVKIDRITLFLFGGIANMGQRPPSAGTEFLFTAAGPLASFGLGGLFLALRAVLIETGAVIPAILLYLGVINMLLGLFNLIPGYPLDGGRILHSIIWAISDHRERATKIASAIGIGVAWLFIIGGIAMIFLGASTANGVWIAFIGWFLSRVAGARYTEATDALEHGSTRSA